MLFYKQQLYKQHQAEILFEIIRISIMKRTHKISFSMEELLNKEHYCYKIHTLLMKSSAHPQ